MLPAVRVQPESTNKLYFVVEYDDERSYVVNRESKGGLYKSAMSR